MPAYSQLCDGVVRIENMRKLIILTIMCLSFAGAMYAQHFDGMASYYGAECHGKKSANGSKFDMHAYTCAHKSLPFGTKLRVTNINNGKSIVVTVTDRGPYVRRRIIDLSFAAAKEIDMMRSGVAPVSIEIVKEGEPLSAEAALKATPLKIKKAEKVEFKTIEDFGSFKIKEHKFEMPNILLDHRVS